MKNGQYSQLCAAAELRSAQKTLQDLAIDQLRLTEDQRSRVRVARDIVHSLAREIETGNK